MFLIIDDNSSFLITNSEHCLRESDNALNLAESGHYFTLQRKQHFMKYFFLFFTILLVMSYRLKAQDRPKLNLIYLEFLGNGPHGSISYERVLLNHIHGRVGVGFFRVGGSTYLTLPIGILFSQELGHSNIFLDPGVGVTFAKRMGAEFFRENEPGSFLVKYIPSVGIRYNFGKSWICRASFNPVIGTHGHDFSLSGGLVIGKRF